ncbi:MAG: hypothetical protein ACKO73_10400, partial [Acidimicrobiaceae bacterium]
DHFFRIIHVERYYESHKTQVSAPALHSLRPTKLDPPLFNLAAHIVVAQFPGVRLQIRYK